MNCTELKWSDLLVDVLVALKIETYSVMGIYWIICFRTHQVTTNIKCIETNIYFKTQRSTSQLQPAARYRSILVSEKPPQTYSTVISPQALAHKKRKLHQKGHKKTYISVLHNFYRIKSIVDSVETFIVSFLNFYETAKGAFIHDIMCTSRIFLKTVMIVGSRQISMQYSFLVQLEYLLFYCWQLLRKDESVTRNLRVSDRSVLQACFKSSTVYKLTV